MSNYQVQALKSYCQKLMRRVSHWKIVFANWHLGTKDPSDGTFQAIQDLYDDLLRKQVKIDAAIEILTAKGILSPVAFLEKQIEVAVRLDQSLESKFPGVKTTDAGLDIDEGAYQETKDRLNFPL